MRQLKISARITQRDSLALDKYLNDIGKIEMLTPEQESELAARIRLGDEEALHILTRANLRFVISVAKQYQHQGLSLEDLINEGNMGLIKAAKRFDETRGFKFISYAVWWIRQSILQALVESSRLVRLPLHKIGSQTRINEAYISFMQEFEREPTAEELADLLGMKEKDVQAALRQGLRHVSVDAPLGGEDGDDALTMLDTLPCSDSEIPETQFLNESLQQEVREGLRILGPREAEVLEAYYGLGGKPPMTLEEIGEMCELTRERVRQIKERAIRRLRKAAQRNNNLRSFLG